MEAESIRKFRDSALLELKRAERYRTFLSLLVLNLSELMATVGRRKIDSADEADYFFQMALDRVKQAARETDMISFFEDGRLAMLLPETDMSGAQTAAVRLETLISEFLGEFLQSDYRFDIPTEITSFPGPASDISLKARLMKLTPQEN